MANNNYLPQGYKQTELGAIPEDWEVKPFSQIFDMYPNNTYPRDCMNDSRGVVRNIHYGDVLIKYPTIVDVGKCAIPYLSEDVKIKLQKLVQSGDIIIADTAEDETVGKCVEIKNVGNNKIVAGLHTFFCRPTTPFAAGWLGYYINSTNYHNQLIPYITGIKVSSISRTAIQETKLLIPPLAEQRAIAEALSDVDDLITALDKKIAKKRLIKQGAMQQLLTGKKRLPGFKEEWEKKRLGDIGYTYSGLIGKTKNDFGHGNAKYITFLNVLTNPVLKESLFESVVVDDNEHQNKVQYGDLFFNTSSETPEDVGTCAVILSHQQNLYLNSFCFGYRLTDNNVLGLYLSYYFRSNNGRQLMTSLAQGATRYNLSKDLFNSSYITIPRTKDEQQTIATILSDMDKEIAELEAQRDKYRLVKSGMMQKLLTGEIRLKKPQASQILESKAIPVDAHIIAGHIVNRLYKSEGWGRTKLQKSLHLAGYYAQIYIGNEYIRNTAGPDDQRLMNYIDQQFRQFNHVKITRVKLNNGKIHYNYTPTSLIQEVEMAYEKYPENVRKQIDILLDKMNVMDLDCAEILSTLYGVWNNRIIKSERITDDLLIADFYAWSKHKLEFDESRLRKALVYMREENIVPIGWGKYIDKRQNENYKQN